MKKLTTAFFTFLICTSITAQNVGIGTTTPNYPLTLRTTSPAQPFGLVQTNGTDSAGLWVNSVYGWLGSITNKPFHIGANNQPGQLTVWPNGNVGIGTIAMPTTKLEINGKIKITDGNQAAGKVLTSDASGEAKWETPSGGFSLPYAATQNFGGTLVEVINAGGGSGIAGSSTNDNGVFGYTTNGKAGVAGQSYGTAIGGLFSSSSGYALITREGNVGIGTNTPQAPFTVAPNKTVLFGADTLNGGTKMLWLPSKRAFRGGELLDDPSRSGIETDFWNTDSVGLNSFAFGYNVKAKGENSIALGIGSTALGVGSIGLGPYSFATGNSSLANANSWASGFNSVALGYGARASGNYSFSCGDGSLASGNSSFATGFSTASGLYSFSGGWLSNASNTYSTAIGAFTKANGYSSTAFGYFSKATSLFSTSFGVYNDTIAGSNSNSNIWVPTDPLITVGNGYADGAIGVPGYTEHRHNALTIYKNGNHDIAGYTRLGEASEGAVRIKTKKLTGTTPNNMNPGTFTFLAHGIADASKILSVSVLVTDGIYQFLPHSPDIGAIYTVNVDGGNIAVGVKSAVQSASVMGKPIKVLITYEE